jgi:hypothetical protein
MELTSEVFGMVVYLLCLPLCIIGIVSSRVPGGRFFIVAYVCLTASTIFTVVEEFWLKEVFNLLEHFFIFLSSILFMLAVRRVTAVNLGEGERSASVGNGR